MLTSSTLECVHVSVTSNIGTVRFADSATVKLPSQALSRSSLLHQALSETDHANYEVSLSLPEGVLVLWMEALRAIGVDVHAQQQLQPASQKPVHIRDQRHLQPSVHVRDSEQQQPAAKVSNLPRNSQRLLEYLVAADFLVDTATVKELCNRVAHTLFAPFMDSGERHIDSKLALGLVALPINLQDAVLAASKVPTILQLWLLPQSQHQEALHAAFPSIAAASSLIIHCPLHGGELGDPFWRSVGTETHLTSLQCIDNTSNSAVASEQLLQCLGNLSNLQSLSLAGVRALDARLARILSCLSCGSCLTHLDLSGQKRSPDDASASELSRAFEKLTVLRSVDVSEFNLEGSCGTALVACITQLRFLQSLSMNDCHISISNSKTLGNYIATCTSLQTLRCHRNTCSGEFLHQLCCCQNLQRLELPDDLEISWQRQMGITFDQPLALQPVFKLTALTELHFPSYGMEDRDIVAAAAHMTCLSTLLSIHVYGWVVEKAGFEALAALVGNLPLLQSFSFYERSPLFHPRLQDADANALAACVSAASKLKHLHVDTLDTEAPASLLVSALEGLTDLQTLEFHRIQLTASDTKTLSQNISRLLTLHTIKIQSVKLDESALKMFFQAIRGLSALHTLQLVNHPMQLLDNTTSTLGMEALAGTLCNLTSLTHLKLQGITIQPSALHAFAEHLQCLTGLQSLELQRTGLGDVGVIALAPVFSNLTTLTLLGLEDNDLECDAAVVLSEHVPDLVALKQLNLSVNGIQSRGGSALVQCIRRLPALTVIDLRRNRLSSIASKLSRCPQVRHFVEGLEKQL